MRLTALISSRVACGLRERDVLGDRAVEQEVVLQHDAEVRAVVAQLHVVEVAAVDEHAALTADG